MKHFLLLSVFLFFSDLLLGQYYAVTANIAFNIEKSIHKPKNDKMGHVFDFHEKRAEIDLSEQNDIFVKTIYLEKGKDLNKWTEQSHKKNSDTHKNFFWGMLILTVLFFAIRLKHNWGGIVIFLFTTICLAEIIYYSGCLINLWKEFFPAAEHYGAMWFCHPRSVGIFWGILNSFIFIFFASSQVMIALELAGEDFSFGIRISYIYVVLCNIGNFLLFGEDGNLDEKIFLGIYFICMLVQAIIIAKKKGFFDAVVYFCCIFGSAVIFSSITGWFMFFVNTVSY